MFEGAVPVVPISALGAIAHGIDHAEGICLTPDGVLHVSGEQGQIYRPEIVFHWRPDGPAELLASDPEGTALAAPTNAAFFGPDLAELAVPNIGRRHVTTFSVPGLHGVPLNYPDRERLGY